MRHHVRPELLEQGATLVPIDTLTYHPLNARQHDDELLRESLIEHGQYHAVRVQRSTGYIVGGNGTVYNMRALGWTHVAAVFLNLDDRQALKILAVDNKASDNAVDDPGDMARLLATLDGDLTGTGWTDEEYRRLVAFNHAPLTFDDEPTRTGAGLREVILTLPADDHAELVRLFDAVKAATGNAPQGEVALLTARLAVAVLDGGAGHRPDCPCDWCSIARQAGITHTR